ncbi:hypothetical protein BGY98DRAFT_1010010, partial [Russula aff. rugulosa BPL654]
MSNITTDSSLRKVLTETAWAIWSGHREPTLVFVSGCLGLDPKTGNFVEGGVEAQTRRALQNLKGIV